MRRAAVYTRISSDRTGEQLGVKRQERDARKLCTDRGWNVAGVYTDDDRSAYSGRARPEYSRLLADLKAGTVDAVVAWHPDRLHRSPRELEDFIDLIEATRADVATVTAGEYDLGTASGRMSARIVGAVARHESEHKSERIRRKHLELAEHGQVSGGGRRPFGYEADRMTIRPGEADEIQAAVARVLAGEALRSVVRDWNDRGVRTVTGTPWSATTLKRLLRSGRISGQREHRGELVADAVWPAIVTKADTARLRRLLDDVARDPGRAPRRYLLPGLVHCGRCGARMTTRPTAKGRGRYICSTDRWDGCGRCGIAADPLDELIVDAVGIALDGPELAAALAMEHAGDDDAVAAEIADVAARLEELAAEWGAGTIDRSQWLAARKPLEARRDDLRAGERSTARTTVLEAIVGHGVDLRQLPLDRRHAVVAAVVERIDIAPTTRATNYFDVARITVTWRQ